MNPEAIRKLLSRRPFLPFVVRLSSGESYGERHSECIAIAKTRIVVTEPEEDRVAVCSLMHVTSVDDLQTT
ncbi:MAG: hypothetical protein ACK6CT_12000 [Planctomycetia bacterium]|jgi:hypothetical protein